MEINEQEDLLFEINLLFPERKNAIKAFNQITKFYEILSDFDKVILRNIIPNSITEYGLEDVAYSSLRTKLYQLLKLIPDDLLKDLSLKKVIGFFLIKAKYLLIKLLQEEKEIISQEQIQTVTDKINIDIKEFGVSYKIIVTQINNYIILNTADDLAKQVNALNDKEVLEYKSKAGNTNIGKGVFLNKPKILAELGQNSITNETTEILKLKKIELLNSEPKWEFLQGKRKLVAKMMDRKWLEDFHNRKVIIKPEDSLLLTLKTSHNYTQNFEKKETLYEIIKVTKVISPDDSNFNQLSL